MGRLSATGDIDFFTADVVFVWMAAASVFVVLKTPKIVEAWRRIGCIDLSVFRWSRVLRALYTSQHATFHLG